MYTEPVIYLIAGPPASGKSTVARLLASRFERGVHLEGEVFRRSIVKGHEEMTFDPSPDAVEQLRLRHRLAAAAADAYFEAGFGVALEDVVPGPMLGDYRTLIHGRPCHVIVLVPSNDFRSETPRVGLWLDTSDLTLEETVEEILAQTSSTRSPLVVTPYDDDWPLFFEEIAQPVRDAVADLCAQVEHVGSTSVPGLAAKPIIDIDVVVGSAGDVPNAIERLRSLGYVYQGDKGIRGREAFMWPHGARPHHIYVVVRGSRPYLDHIEFRDYLRDHPEVASGYGALKTELAEKLGMDPLGYADAKDNFVSGVLRAARERTNS